MARPTGWDILGLDGDPTPGVVESVQALAKQFETSPMMWSRHLEV